MEATGLEVRNLGVRFRLRGASLLAVDDISFSVQPGEMVAIVGESGSGKSTAALAITRLLEGTTAQIEGSVLLDGEDLLAMSGQRLNKVRGRRISMIFQESRAALNPSKTIGRHLVETLRLHLRLDKNQAWQRGLSVLNDLMIPDPDRVMNAYPHQLSGGMCQRVMIALGLACEPEFMIADEPTASLDPTTGMEILTLLRRVREVRGTGIVLITHNLALAANLTDRVLVMYAGQLVETGTSAGVLTAPEAPYTAGLLASTPQMADSSTRRLHSIDGTAMHGSQGVGCRFANRCPHMQAVCRREMPQLLQVGIDRYARCWFPASGRGELPPAAGNLDASQDAGGGVRLT